CPSRSSISLYKWVYPIQPPQCKGRKICWIGNNRPILMDQRKHSVHQIGYIFEVWGNVLTDVNRFFSVTTAMLRNVRDGCVIQRPKRVFVERFYAFFEANFYAV